MCHDAGLGIGLPGISSYLGSGMDTNSIRRLGSLGGGGNMDRDADRDGQYIFFSDGTREVHQCLLSFCFVIGV